MATLGVLIRFWFPAAKAGAILAEESAEKPEKPFHDVLAWDGGHETEGRPHDWSRHRVTGRGGDGDGTLKTDTGCRWSWRDCRSESI